MLHWNVFASFIYTSRICWKNFDQQVSNGNVLFGDVLTKRPEDVFAILTGTFWLDCIRSERLVRLLCSVNTKTFAAMCDTYENRHFCTISHVILIISFISYFRHSPQLQKTTILEHANTIGCPHNVLRVSLIQILFIELFFGHLLTFCKTIF